MKLLDLCEDILLLVADNVFKSRRKKCHQELTTEWVKRGAVNRRYGPDHPGRYYLGARHSTKATEDGRLWWNIDDKRPSDVWVGGARLLHVLRAGPQRQGVELDIYSGSFNENLVKRIKVDPQKPWNLVGYDKYNGALIFHYLKDREDNEVVDLLDAYAPHAKCGECNVWADPNESEAMMSAVGRQGKTVNVVCNRAIDDSWSRGCATQWFCNACYHKRFKVDEWYSG